MALQSRGFSLNTLPQAAVMNYNPRPLDFSPLVSGIQNFVNSRKQAGQQRLENLAAEYALAETPEQRQSILDTAEEGGFLNSLARSRITPEQVQLLGDELQQQRTLSALQEELQGLRLDEARGQAELGLAQRLAQRISGMEVPAGADPVASLGLSEQEARVLPIAERLITQGQAQAEAEAFKRQMEELEYAREALGYMNDQAKAQVEQAKGTFLAGGDMSKFPATIRAIAEVQGRAELANVAGREATTSSELQPITVEGVETGLFRDQRTGRTFNRTEDGQVVPLATGSERTFEQRSAEGIVDAAARRGVFVGDYVNEEGEIDWDRFNEANREAMSQSAGSVVEFFDNLMNQDKDRPNNPIVTPPPNTGSNRRVITFDD